MQVENSPSRAERRRKARPAPEFPGCRTITIRRDQIGTHEGRFEFWDAASETAWMVRDPTSATHEYPSHRLSALSEMIASMRGSAIACFGAMDLELRGERGERQRIMQADQSVYLHPGRSRLPREAGMVIGEHDFPDVVVEVDHTTDVRRGKLGLYEEWGFPEVWVEVPDGMRRAARPAGCRGSRFISSRADAIAPRLRAMRFRGGRRRDPHCPERAGPHRGDRRGARPGGTGARRA